MDSLQDAERNWVQDQKRLQDMAFQHFSRLYQSNLSANRHLTQGCFLGLKTRDRLQLSKKYTYVEIYAALSEMGSLKALSPNGFEVIFFQKTWYIVKKTACNFVRVVVHGVSSFPLFRRL